MSLYGSPTAAVLVNGQILERFCINNGTRQGCPLSPLIFILTMESLLCTVRANPDIHGIEVGPMDHKVAAYADDLLFFITQPLVTVAVLVEELRAYGQLSAYSINMRKSEALDLTLTKIMKQSLNQNFSFKWAPHAIKYLGVRISAEYR